MAKRLSILMFAPIILYLPLGAILIGLLANSMRLDVPSTGSSTFGNVFFAYALRLPEEFTLVRWLPAIIGLAILGLMTVAARSAKPIVTLVQVRIVILMLLVVLTILTHIFVVVMPLARVGAAGPFDSSPGLQTAVLFLFSVVDFILAFLATFLPLYRPLKKETRRA